MATFHVYNMIFILISKIQYKDFWNFDLYLRNWFYLEIQNLARVRCLHELRSNLSKIDEQNSE